MVDQILNQIKENSEKNQQLIPKPSEFPVVEHAIAVLYQQTYIATLIGLPNASLIMQGVLMEEFVKYLHYHFNKKEFNGKLEYLIKRCHEDNLFSKDKERNEKYFTFFDNFRKLVRNTQIHFLSKKQTKGMGVRGMKITIPTLSDGSIDGSKFLQTLGDAKKNFGTMSETLWTDENPGIRNVLKFKLDENTYLQQFVELHKVLLELNKEHNLDYKENTRKL
ncbi:MAG: hypothetical protein KJ597_02370 [Nanoarchaeota archaeon]|nr:hypothetical protein [Nanoarchaeota archaeon]MBU1622395.1 hypothetical protein [Nanoarchaeota archaeon]